MSDRSNAGFLSLFQSHDLSLAASPFYKQLAELIPSTIQISAVANFQSNSAGGEMVVAVWPFGSTMAIRS